jgi:hypothetical protein
VRTKIFITILLFVSSILSAEVPQMINYQAQLLDPSTDQPVADDTYQITFKIYDTEAATTASWTEMHQVQTQTGMYNVLLGSQYPITNEILTGAEKWLGVKVGADNEMLPRKRFTSVAYAIEAGNSVTAGTDDDWVKDGDDVYIETGNVGIGEVNPTEKLEVSGAIKFGNTNNSNAGSVRWTGTEFEGFDGNNWVSLTKPVNPTFRVGKNTSQTIPISILTNLTWDIIDFDTNNDFDLENDKFIPKIAGKYLLTATVNLLYYSDGLRAEIAVKKNGIIELFGTSIPAGVLNAHYATTVTLIVDANGIDDYFEVCVRHFNSSAIDTDSYNKTVFFSGTLVSH